MSEHSYDRQVDPLTHYSFGEYLGKQRWASIWHQADVLLAVKPKSVLEVGVGTRILELLLGRFGVECTSVDFDADLQPDYVASVTALPFEDDSFDAVGCFQVLEHIRYEDFQIAVGELCRVARTRVAISIPDVSRVWQYFIYIPFRGKRHFLVKKPWDRPKPHTFDGQHHWELNAQEYPMDRIMSDMAAAGMKNIETFRVFEHPYHRFFIGTPGSAKDPE